MIDIIKKNISNLFISKIHKKKLEIYYSFLIEQNKLFNLTTITNKKDVYYKHFLDSLLFLKLNKFNINDTICDVGSGAGFPGIVLKIFNPDINLTIIESSRKRCVFLENLIKKLFLKKINIVNCKVEFYNKLFNNWNGFDFVFVRALSSLNVLLELCSDLVKINGYLICYKGPNVYKEILDIDNVLNIFGFVLNKIQSENIMNLGKRNICYFLKNKKINIFKKNNFPRSIKNIKKRKV